MRNTVRWARRIAQGVAAESNSAKNTRRARGVVSATLASAAAQKSACIRLLAPPTQFERTIPEVREHLGEVIREADRIVSGERFLFGKSIRITGPGDYCVNPFSSRQLDPRSALVLDSGIFGQRDEIRMLWELNRCHHMVKLGQAWAVTGNTHYVEALMDDLRLWNTGNELGRTLNWNCPMEAAVRLINWLCAASLCLSCISWTSEFHHGFMSWVEDHVSFILGNLEQWGKKTQNHYFSDLVGIIAGLTFSGATAADSPILNYAVEEFQKSLEWQVYSDGVSFENSFGYQCLMTELASLGTEFCVLAGYSINAKSRARLERMETFLASIATSGGDVPHVGDSDDGRVLALGTYFGSSGWLRRPDSLRALVQTAVDSGLASEESVPESTWRAPRPPKGSGVAGVRLPVPTSSAAFADGGIYVLRSPRIRCVALCAPTGLPGIGSHRHNDALSYLVHIDNKPVVIDSGTYCYLFSEKWRQYYRQTQAHNCLSFDGVQQADYQGSFCLANDDMQMTVREWHVSDNHAYLEVLNEGYSRRTGLTHSRTWDLYDDTLYIRDQVLGSGKHQIDWYMHLDYASSWRLVKQDDGHFLAVSDIAELRTGLASPKASLEAHLEWAELSESFHQVRLHPVIHLWVRDVEVPLALSVKISPRRDA